MADQPPLITIDYTPAYEQGAGIGRYVRELVSALGASLPSKDYRFRLFVEGVPRGGIPLDIPYAHQFEWRASRLKPKHLARIWHKARLPIPVEVWAGYSTLYHATDFVLPPTLPGTKTLLTVHDLSFVRVPEAASPRLKQYLDRWVPDSVRRAHHILADSQATKDDLVALYGTPTEKITVLLSAADARFQKSDVSVEHLRTKYHLPARPYILCVGTVQPRKNYERVVRALARLRSEGHNLDLVIVGGKGWLDGPLYDTIRAESMTDYVHLTGFADEQDLPAFYTHALCVAFPSLYEGFGFPVLEGFGCQTPVMTSNISSLPEVAGDAALMVNPLNLDEITDALRQLVTDAGLRRELVARGQERIKLFTWHQSAQQLLKIYEQVLNA